MILVCNGDSWTQGDNPAQTPDWEAEKTLPWYDIPRNFGSHGLTSKRILYKFYNSPVWPKVVGENLKLKTFNAGRLGDDNRGITLRTIAVLEDLKNPIYNLGTDKFLVVVGWSSMLRQSIFEFQEEKNKFLKSQRRPHQFFREELPESSMWIDDFILNVYTLQSYLESINANILFFNAFDTFDYKNSRYKDLIKKEYWFNNDPESAHFLDLLQKLFGVKELYQESKYMTTGHPTDISHITWAHYLTDYIKENGLN